MFWSILVFYCLKTCNGLRDPASRQKKVLGLLYWKFYSYSSTDALTQLYVSLVRPHLEYACPVWTPHFVKMFEQLKMCKNLHAKWPRIIETWATKIFYNPGTELPTLEKRRLDLKLGQLFKIIHNLRYFPEGIIKLREQTPLLTNTRFLHLLYLHQPLAHTNSFQYSFVPHPCSLWNSLPFSIVNASSLSMIYKIIIFSNNN